MSIATAVNLMPDETFFPMLGIFLFAMIVLTFFVFRPVLKILDARNKATDGALQKSREFEDAASKLEEEIAKRIDDTHAQGSKVRAETRSSAEQDARTIIEKARKEASESLIRGQSDRERSRAEITDKMSSQIPTIANLIAERTLFERKASKR